MSSRKFKAISALGFKFIKPIKFDFLSLCKFGAALGFEQKFKICMLADERRFLVCANLNPQTQPRKSALSREIICV